jgi:hypothetical protein
VKKSGREMAEGGAHSEGAAVATVWSWSRRDVVGVRWGCCGELWSGGE